MTMNHKAQNDFSRGSQAGLTLVELMIAIAIGLLILAALLALFINLTRSNSEMAKTNVQIENGRAAIQLMQKDLVHAGFWGSYVPQFDDLSSTAVPTDVPNAVPDPCLPSTPINWTSAYKTNLLGIPVQSYDAIPAGCTTLLTNQQANTDVLVIRHAETCVPGENNCEADTPGKLYFQSTRCSTESATPYVLGTAGFALHNRDCATVADKRKYISNIYYIRDYAVTAGDGIPTLVLSQFDLISGTPQAGTAIPLIEGIEGFRVEFGIDSLSDSGAAANYTQAVVWANPVNLTSPTNRGDGAPDGAFVHCSTLAPCTPSQLVNVVAVKLYVIARSRETTPGYTDGKTYTLGSTTWTPTNTSYKRHLFSTSVRLTNVSGRRETP